MAYKDLQEFIKVLKQKGELIEVTAPVSSELEITEITDRVSKNGGPGLLFTNVEDSKYPILINAMGSWNRMNLALKTGSCDQIGDEISQYLDLGNYLSIRGLIRSIRRLFRLFYVFPLRTIGTAPCQEVVEKNVNLKDLPVLKCWPQDAGPFITLPLVFTKERRGKGQNCGMYRMQILDHNTTGMHWHKHKDGSSLYMDYKMAGEKMPVSVALGCDPAITYAATAPLPKKIDEMMFAGWLRKRNVRMVRCKTNKIYVPKDAEFVLEGYVDPKEELVLEGPFGDHTGYYSLADYYPKFHVTCITHKKHAVYPATVVGKPPMEDCFMATATERIFLPFIKMQIPEITDIHLPLEGVFHNCAVVSVNQTYPGVAQKVMNAIWGMGQMMYTKMIIIVDAAFQVQDMEAVVDEICRQVRGKDDIVLSKGPLDALDHSSNEALYGTRIGIDATKKQHPDTASYERKVQVVAVNKTHAKMGQEAVKEAMNAQKAKIVVAVDESVNVENRNEVLWKVFNNIDGSRDLVFLDSCIGIDATKKWKEEGILREWPDDIEMSEEIKDKVNKRWSEYGIRMD